MPIMLCITCCNIQESISGHIVNICQLTTAYSTEPVTFQSSHGMQQTDWGILRTGVTVTIAWQAKRLGKLFDEWVSKQDLSSSCFWDGLGDWEAEAGHWCCLGPVLANFLPSVTGRQHTLPQQHWQLSVAKAYESVALPSPRAEGPTLARCAFRRLPRFRWFLQDAESRWQPRRFRRLQLHALTLTLHCQERNGAEQCFMIFRWRADDCIASAAKASSS